MKFQSLYLGAVFLAACTPVLPARATVVIEDTFTGRYSPDETVKLAGTSPDTAGTSLTWTASDSLVFKNNGTNDYLTAETTQHANMSLLFDYSLYSDNGNIITVAITLNSGGSGTSDKWIGFGFSRTGSFSSPTSNGSLWLQISRRSTTANWYLRNGNTQLATGALGEGCSLADSNTFSFSYDVEHKTVIGVFLNGVNVLEAPYVFATAPTLGSVGAFFQFADSNVNKITDFSATLSSIPEPGGWALIGGVLLSGFAFARRFSRR
jgi:hypothetical protein